MFARGVGCPGERLRRSHVSKRRAVREYRHRNCHWNVLSTRAIDGYPSSHIAGCSSIRWTKTNCLRPLSPAAPNERLTPVGSSGTRVRLLVVMANHGQFYTQTKRNEPSSLLV